MLARSVRSGVVESRHRGSLVAVDGGGTVVAQCREGVSTLAVDLDMDYLRSVRQRMPVLEHRRGDLFD